MNNDYSFGSPSYTERLVKVKADKKFAALRVLAVAVAVAAAAAAVVTVMGDGDVADADDGGDDAGDDDVEETVESD